MFSQQKSPVVSQHRSFDTVSVWALISTLVIAIFIFIPSIAIPFIATKTIILAVGVFIVLTLYILARLTRGNIILPSLTLVGALWLPVVAYLISSVFSETPFSSALWGSLLGPDTLGFMIIVAFLGTLSALVLRRPEQYRTFFRAGTYVFGIIVILEILVVIAGQFFPQTIPSAFSILGTFSDLAYILGLGVIASLLTLRFVDVSKRVRKVLIVSGIGALFLIALANTALIWILIAIVALGLFVEIVMRRSSQGIDSDLDEAVLLDEAPVSSDEGTQSLVVPLSVLIVSLFFLISGTLGGVLASSLNINILNVRPSWQSTLSVTGKVYSASPIFGSGPGTFGVQWLKYRSSSLNSTAFWNADFSSGIGFIPTSFVTTGGIGAVAWLTFLVLFIVLGIRMLILRTPQDIFVRYISITSFVGSLYLFSIALFDLPGTVIIALAFVFAGLFISTMRFASDGKQWGILFSRSPRIGFVIVFLLTILLLSSVVAVYSTTVRYIATIEFTKASDSLSSGKLDTAYSTVQKSISFAPTVEAYQIQIGIAKSRLSAVTASTTIAKSVAQKEYQKALSNGINAALTATRIDSTGYKNWLALGNLYAQTVSLGVKGSYDSAKSAYNKALALNPTNPQIPYVLAQLEIANKNTKTAKTYLKTAISLKQDYTPAIFLLSQLEVRDGNVKEALASALAAAYFTPNNPNILFQVGVLYAAQNKLTQAVSALSSAVTANPKFANARYFLSAVYAKQGNMKSAIVQMQAIADMSSANAKAIAPKIKDLKKGKNPFSKNLLKISTATVKASIK